MPRPKVVFVCDSCGGQQPKWQGQCPDCGAWNTLTESVVVPRRAERAQHSSQAELTRLDRVDVGTVERLTTGLSELDRVLGGGLVPGGVVLIGGDPGIGKSTLLLQALANISHLKKTLYVSGEESGAQIALRAKRLGVDGRELKLQAEIQLEKILTTLADLQPEVAVIDSIQTVYSAALTSAPGSVAQVR